VLSGSQRAFKAGDSRRLSAREFCDLRLRQTCFVPGLEKEIKQSGFFSLDTFDLLPNTRTAHQLLDDLLMSSHVLLPSFSLRRS